MNLLQLVIVKTKVARTLRYFSNSFARDFVKVKFAGATPKKAISDT